MQKIILRNLPGIAEIEARAALRNDGKLMKDELEQLATDIDTVSRQLFGVTESDTLYAPELLERESIPYDEMIEIEKEWASKFEFLYEEREEEAVFWEAFNCDLSDGRGEWLECAGDFDRQILCVVRGYHPNSRLAAIANPGSAMSAIEWEERLTQEAAAFQEKRAK